MADNKKYYYLKLKDNFFDDEKIVILESLPDGHLYSNILLKLYLKSLKGNGRLMFNDRIPYNSQLLAQLTRHPVGVIEKAIDIFIEFELIEAMTNGAIYITDIQNFIGSSSSEADRQREYQRRLKESDGNDSKAIAIMKSCKESNVVSNGKSNGYESNVEPCKEPNGVSNRVSDNCYKSNMKSCKESNMISTPEIRDKRLEIRDKKLEIKEQRLETKDLDFLSNADILNLENLINKKKEELEKHKISNTDIIEPISQSISQLTPSLSDVANNYFSLNDSEIQYFIDCWSNLNASDPIRKLNEKQTKKLIDNVKRYGEGQEPMETINCLIDSITDSNYLMGDTEPKFELLIDWVLKPENWKKVIDGNYQNWENPEI